MKLKTFFLLLLCCFSTLFAADVYQQTQAPEAIFVDDFEDGNLNHRPMWWRFGELDAQVVQNIAAESPYLEKASLRLSGNPSQLFVGGMGAYVGADLMKYNAVKLLVKGKGKNSGSVIIELYDDDNFNWDLELFPKFPSQPSFDDRFVYTLKVNWTGWKMVIIPFTYFFDSNTTVGDNKWNPEQLAGSGGLLQTQLIVMAANPKTVPDISIDFFKFIVIPPDTVLEPRNMDMPEFVEWW